LPRPTSWKGYRELDEQLRAWLCQATGYAGISLQPNAGSQGEYAGLLVIKAFHEAAARPPQHLPDSQQRTRHQPGQRQMVGMTVVVTKPATPGQRGPGRPASQMRTAQRQPGRRDDHLPQHPRRVRNQREGAVRLVHSHGGRVYVDGANMNALVGVAAPGEFGGDVSHLNLHKTFCIPHGGGGPGVGPVCVVADLVPYLPGHATALHRQGGIGQCANVSAWARVSRTAGQRRRAADQLDVLPHDGRRRPASTPPRTAILSANYISARLKDHYPTLYAAKTATWHTNAFWMCAASKKATGGANGMAEDVAKRLMDYGFPRAHLSFPVPGTLMVEPTESETLDELDRFIDAMIAIRNEIAQSGTG
jgi:glycine dehydrogenase